MKHTSSLFFLVLFSAIVACQSSKNVEEKAKKVAFITLTEVIFTDSTKRAFPEYAASDSLTVFFVLRHAEKDTGDNPPLSRLGEERAKQLARIFKNSGVTHVFATPYRRTLFTAKPVATITDAPVLSFDFKNAEDAASFYFSKAKGGRIFIAGHSNTNPQLVNYFAKKEVLPQIPDEQYDDMYVVFVPQKGEATWWALKY